MQESGGSQNAGLASEFLNGFRCQGIIDPNVQLVHIECSANRGLQVYRYVSMMNPAQHAKQGFGFALGLPLSFAFGFALGNALGFTFFSGESFDARDVRHLSLPLKFSQVVNELSLQFCRNLQFH
jgi:hypothetical protein